MTERIPFTALIDGYKSPWYGNSGVVEYAISTADYGRQKIIVSLQGDSIVLDGKEYVVTPEQHEFTIQSSSADVLITEIDGEALNGNKEVKFVLKEVQSEADKTALEAKLAEVKAITKGNYTINSYNALQNAIANAEKLVEDSDATQAEVDAAVQSLSDAQNALREVIGMRTLIIPVQLQDGVSAPANTKFIRYDCKYYVENNMFTKNGVLEWKLGSYDGGDYEFYLPEGSVYIGTPERIKVHVGTEDGTPVIETINGVPAAEASAKFIITQRGVDTCDILTFRALVKDSEGNALSNVRFKVANGDPSELVSDEKGVIEYEVTAWDTDTTMIVSLAEGQEWYTDETVEFSVIQDPAVPDRGIIDTINGQPLDSNHTVVFTLIEPVKDRGWKKDAIGWWYKNPDGSYPSSVWKFIAGERYYFNAAGYMVTGWQVVDGTDYYFTSDGAMVTNQWIGDYYLGEDGKMVSNVWVGVYYTGADGAYQKGWLKLTEGWYYLGIDGVVQTGWIKVDNIWYYGNPEFENPGLLIENDWLTLGDVRYHFYTGGAMAMGWTLIDGDYYYFNESGAMLTDAWVGDYYLDKDGKMATNSWVGVYHVGADGAYQTGWLKLGEEWYYLGANGAMAHNEWSGNYYLKEDGKMARNEWVDGGKYFVNENGVWVPNAKK